MRRGDCARPGGPHRVHAPRADRLRSDVRLLHHPFHARGRAGAVHSATCCLKSTASSDAGYREVAITGVHLGSYGRDLADGSSLVALLQAIERHALGHAVPHQLARADGLLRRDRRPRGGVEDCFAPHFHLPLQHASDGMLVAMRRPYTLAYYRRLVDRIRERIPHASIGTGHHRRVSRRNRRDFERARGVSAQSPITHVHVFPVFRSAWHRGE